MKNSRGKQATGLVHDLVKAPPGSPNSFLGFPLALDLDNLDADIAILGVPFGLPYVVGELANDQSRAPDAIRQNAQDAAWEEPRTRVHFDWDLGGPLLENRPVKVVDCSKSDQAHCGIRLLSSSSSSSRAACVSRNAFTYCDMFVPCVLLIAPDRLRAGDDSCGGKISKAVGCDLRRQCQSRPWKTPAWRATPGPGRHRVCH